MSRPQFIDVGPGFVRARECPDCFHTHCGEDCICNCDAAHAEHEAAGLKAQNAELADALSLALSWVRGGHEPCGKCRRCRAAAKWLAALKRAGRL
jgi:hypothetical protein